MSNFIHHLEGIQEDSSDEEDFVTTWGENTTIYSTVVDETTIDVTAGPTTKVTCKLGLG